MRIIAGEHRGRLIEAPDGLDTRPTTDRVRESIMSSLFSIFGGFEGLVVLDAFSGSGAMGLEVMSRGAKACVLNDNSKRSREVIRANRDSLGYGDSEVRITATDILASGFPSVSSAYDLVFLDPPYATDATRVMETLCEAANRGVLAGDWVAVYEHSNKLDEDMSEGYGLAVLAHKKYGKTHVTFLTTAGERG